MDIGILVANSMITMVRMMLGTTWTRMSINNVASTINMVSGLVRKSFTNTTEPTESGSECINEDSVKRKAVSGIPTVGQPMSPNIYDPSLSSKCAPHTSKS